MMRFILCFLFSLVAFFAHAETFYEKVSAQTDGIAKSLGTTYDSLLIFSFRDRSRHLVVTNQELYANGSFVGLKIYRAESKGGKLEYYECSDTTKYSPRFDKKVFPRDLGKLKTNLDEPLDEPVLTFVEKGVIKSRCSIEKLWEDEKEQSNYEWIALALLYFNKDSVKRKSMDKREYMFLSVDEIIVDGRRCYPIRRLKQKDDEWELFCGEFTNLYMESGYIYPLEVEEYNPQADTIHVIKVVTRDEHPHPRRRKGYLEWKKKNIYLFER